MQQRWQMGVLVLAALALPALLTGCETVDTLDADAPQNKEYIAVPASLPALVCANTAGPDHA